MDADEARDEARPPPAGGAGFVAEQEVPDVLDYRGRLRRFSVAAAIATLAAVLVGTASYGAAGAELQSPGYISGGAWRFVLVSTVLAWGLVYAGTRWWLERRARRPGGLLPGAAARVRRRR